MILSIVAEEKSGKTTLAYSGPLPIVGFSFDIGSERALYGTRFNELFKGLDIEIVPYKRGDKPEKKWSGHDITIYEMPQPVQVDSEKLLGFLEHWGYFIQLVVDAILDESVKTVVVDTMTLARRIKADAYLQEMQEGNPGKPRKQLLQIEWGHANDSIRDIYTLAAGCRKNLVAIHHLTDQYAPQVTKDGTVESMPTGTRILEGMTGTNKFVDVSVKMEKSSGKFSGLVELCGYAPNLEGMSLPNITWDMLVDLISGSLEGRIKFDKRVVA